MTAFNLSRIAGAAALAIALSAAPAAFAFDTGGGGNGGSGNSGGGNGGSGNGGSDYSSTTTAPAYKPKPAKTTAAAPTLAVARADIKAGNWTKAITDLKLIVKYSPKSADGWNLLGFSYRNHGDLKLADAAYDTALKLNPNHTGALSYQGLLYIKMGEKDEAKANLAKIAKICGNTTCPEYVTLDKALA